MIWSWYVLWPYPAAGGQTMLSWDREDLVCCRVARYGEPDRVGVQRALSLSLWLYTNLRDSSIHTFVQSAQASLPLKIISFVLMHILIVHAFTSTHWHMHPNKASHSVAFVKIRWTPGSAAAKLSWEDSNNCGLLYDPLETLVPCKDFMRTFCVSNMGFITELWMVAFFPKVLRDTPPPLSNKQQSCHAALVSSWFPLDRVLNQKLHNIGSFQAIQRLSSCSGPCSFFSN